MKKLKARIARFHKDTSGSEAVEMVYACVAMSLLVMCIIMILGYALQANALSYAAKRVAREVEVTGQANHESADRLMNSLLDNYREIGGTIDISPNSGSYLNASKKTIQLREKFTVTATGNYIIKIATPSFASNPLEMRLPITVKVIGQSEVYWKH